MRRANQITIAGAIAIIAAVLCFLCLAGCFYGHASYADDTRRASVTIITVGKQISIDPNGYTSDTDKIRVLYPPVMMETQ